MKDYKAFTPEIIQQIRKAVGSGLVVLERSKLEEFGKDAGEDNRTPDLVVEATETEQIQALLRLANRYAFPVTPRGAGSGLAGGAVPVHGGVVLSLARMNRILSIERENLIAVVEPGVINLDLKDAAKDVGLFYPPDPASLDTSSLGGNAATNAGGPGCIKYGTTRDYVLGLEAVLPSGEKIAAGVRTRKGVVGYDLVHLLVGSEGTLGVITKLILKLLPQPGAVTTSVAFFSHLSAAMESVTSILGQGHVPCALEFLDRACLDLVGDMLPIQDTGETDTLLLIELDGPPGTIEKEMEAVGQICMGFGAQEVLMAPDSRKRARLWEIRRQVSLRIEENWPVYIPEDVVVPVGEIADFVGVLPEFERAYGMKIYSFGHAGDGNIHLNITAGSESDMGRVEEGIRGILERVLSMKGTISGEHGIGMAKKRFMPLEISPESLRLQMGIKRLFDPNMVLNPGKIFDMAS
ncbi:MAG: FAD-binding oxidoreductase [Desulfatiglandales bacterium]